MRRRPVAEKLERSWLQYFEQADASKLLPKCLIQGPGTKDEKAASKKNVDSQPLVNAAIDGYTFENLFPEFLINLQRSSEVCEASAIGPAKRRERTLETVLIFE